MCESTVFIERDGKTFEFMTDVAKILAVGDRLRCVGILGEEKSISGRVKEADFINHRIVLTEE